MEVARKIAEKLGVEVTFVEGEWDGLFAGLDSGRYDMVVNGVEITDERAEKYDFTEPYGYIRTALIVAEGNEEIRTFEDLNGKTTTNSMASTYMTLAESYGATVTPVDSLDQTLDLVVAGRVDATLNAEVSFYDYMNVHPDAPVKIVALTDDASHVSIPVRKEEAAASFKAAVDQAIKELKELGTGRDIREIFWQRHHKGISAHNPRCGESGRDRDRESRKCKNRHKQPGNNRLSVSVFCYMIMSVNGLQ